MCDLCEKFRMASDTEEAAMQTTYDLHQRNKNLARKNKEDDKEKGKTNAALIRADDPNALYMKYAFDSGFVRVDLLRRSRRSTPNPDLVHLYTGPLSISAAKFKDLQILCTSGLIPSTYHHFYKSLKHE
ncbi:hypothetical protein NP493_805g00012 [Ridgeia piscesae]|uniref:Uncharacterized protein n=1 Tax=Ridgeia piscesae TaxID=27915 RepID=A0AAD9NLG2_RIDPI|nr:hypothetical protein NP493_805g00012 [Ridgeia piscesae]